MSSALMPDDTVMYCNNINERTSLEQKPIKLQNEPIINQLIIQEDAIIQVNSESNVNRRKCFVLMILCIMDFILILAHCFFDDYILCLFTINSIIGFFGAYFKNIKLVCFFCVAMLLQILCVISIFYINMYNIAIYLVSVFHLVFDFIIFSHAFSLLKDLE